MGWISVVVSAVLWSLFFVFLFAVETKPLPIHVPVPAIIRPVLGIGLFGLPPLSVALPIIAARRASKLWLLMLLSPLAGLFAMMTQVCG